MNTQLHIRQLVKYFHYIPFIFKIVRILCDFFSISAFIETML